MRNRKFKVIIWNSLLMLILLVTACKDNGAGSDEPEYIFDDTRHPDADLYDPGIEDNYSEISHISNFRLWGHYNVHDPTLFKEGDYYYMYSTDVFYGGGGVSQSDSRMQPKIPIRRSTDLVDWEPIGHVFDEMPSEIVEWMREIEPDYEPVSVWAPYIFKAGNEFRLYYSVPANGMKTAYLGLATSSDPEGPWENQGLVVPTYENSPQNGIDPSVIVDQDNGKHWMIYGSWSDGIFSVELDPQTGFRKDTTDVGEVIVRRPRWGDAVPIEGPEVIYNPELDKYFIFVSYDPLMETYNVRVGRADSPEGPYYDMFGNDLKYETENYPRVTAQYRFDDHVGWQGVGHSGLLRDGSNYYFASQGRLGSTEPFIHLMVLHLRKMLWTEDGWPTLSPERYAGVPQVDITEADITGIWENISLEQTEEKNTSESLTFYPGGTIHQYPEGSWSLEGTTLTIIKNENDRFSAEVFRGWDWEQKDIAFLFSGLNPEGYSEWGKKVTDLVDN